MNQAFNLYFRRGESHYLGATIRSSNSRAELFIHFPLGSRKDATHQEQGTRNIWHGCMPDHISFHVDGTVHIKARDARKKPIHYNKLNTGMNMFNLKRGYFQPIFIQSYSLSKERKISQVMKPVLPEDLHSGTCWDITGLKGFSFMVISKCERLNPSNMLTSHGFQNLSIIGKTPILRQVFTQECKNRMEGGSLSPYATDLIVMAVNNIVKLLPKDTILDAEIPKMPITTSICVPPLDLIADMAI